MGRNNQASTAARMSIDTNDGNKMAAAFNNNAASSEYIVGGGKSSSRNVKNAITKDGMSTSHTIN